MGSAVRIRPSRPIFLRPPGTLKERTMKNVKSSDAADDIKAKVLPLAGLVQFQAGSVVSREILSQKTGTVTIFAFDAGAGAQRARRAVRRPGLWPRGRGRRHGSGGVPPTGQDRRHDHHARRHAPCPEGAHGLQNDAGHDPVMTAARPTPETAAHPGLTNDDGYFRARASRARPRRRARRRTSWSSPPTGRRAPPPWP